MATGLLNSNHEQLASTSSSSTFKSAPSPSSSSSELQTSPHLAQPEKKTSQNGSSNKISKTLKIEIPRISSSREIQPQRPHSPCKELEQRSYLFIGPGAKRDLNKHILKLKTAELEESVKKAKKYAMEQSVRFALVKQQQQQQKQQLDLIKKQQALLLMCRIYVGSIFYEVKEEAVKTAFGAFGPIRSITMSWDAATNKHKGFAFIEFETPEAAQLAYEQMNGVLLGGRNIKVGRPSNMPQAQPIIDQMSEEAKGRHRIYVASVHQDLTESDVQSVFEAFGTIKCCNLIRDIQTGKHKGYGFIEFESTQSAQDAIAAMNMFDLGGQLLRVGKAVTPPDIISSQSITPLTGLNPIQTSASSMTAGLAAQLQDIGVFNPINSTASLASSSSSTNLKSVSSSTDLKQEKKIETEVKVNTTPQPVQQVKPPSVQAVSQPSPTAPQTASASTSVTTSVVTTSTSQASIEQKIELTENQKKLLGMSNHDDNIPISLEQQSDLTVKGKEQRLLLMQKLMRRQPESRVVVLRNMVGPEDVDEDLEEEITEECEKYGHVERVVIYQEKQSEEENAEIIVKIFVEFLEAKSVEVAIQSLNGRYFAGRIVKAELYDQNAYDSKDYSG